AAALCRVLRVLRESQVRLAHKAQTARMAHKVRKGCRALRVPREFRGTPAQTERASIREVRGTQRPATQPTMWCPSPPLRSPTTSTYHSALPALRLVPSQLTVP